MQSPFSTILRGVNRDKLAPLNILCSDTHAAYLDALAMTEQMFFGLRVASPFAARPANQPYPWNYQPLAMLQPPAQFRSDMTFDLVLAQDRSLAFATLEPFARGFSIPLICVEHSAPTQKDNVAQHLKQRAKINVFDSEALVNAWGWDPQDPSVVIIKPPLAEPDAKDLERFIMEWRATFDRARI